jgi:hypothetical protein
MISEAETPMTGEFDQFGIYLTTDKFQFDDQVSLSEIKLSDQPLISLEDINTYSFDTHEISLVPSAETRLSAIDLAGKPFVITVGDEAIYAGEFMALYMSRSSDKVVILWPPMENKATLKIQLGYPGPDFFSGEDPRGDPRIQESLSNAGKLP